MLTKTEILRLAIDQTTARISEQRDFMKAVLRNGDDDLIKTESLLLQRMENQLHELEEMLEGSFREKEEFEKTIEAATLDYENMNFGVNN